MIESAKNGPLTHFIEKNKRKKNTFLKKAKITEIKCGDKSENYLSRVEKSCQNHVISTATINSSDLLFPRLFIPLK